MKCVVFVVLSIIRINGKENHPIWKSDDYFALASIGALVEGWVLISPKEHIVSMKKLYKEKNFIDFTNCTLHAMKHQYSGSFIAFEHGSNNCGSDTSCGTDHAHLYIVPYQNSLCEDMFATGLVWKKCKSGQIPSYAGQSEYLFYTELPSNSAWNDPEGFIHILEYPISQYFRKLIANQLNCSDEYNYRQHPRIEVLLFTPFR